jgi:N-acetylmuramoyl-L-alanine amidase
VNRRGRLAPLCLLVMALLWVVGLGATWARSTEDNSMDVFSTVPNPTPVPSETEYKPWPHAISKPPVVAPTPVANTEEDAEAPPEARPFTPPAVKPAKVVVRVADEAFVMHGLQLEPDHTSAVSVGDPRVQALFELYGVRLHVHTDTKRLECAHAGLGGRSVVLAEGNADFTDRAGRCVHLQTPLFAHEGKLWLPLAALPHLLEGRLQGTGHATYQLDPLVTSIEAVTLQGGAACLAIGSRVPIKWKAFMVKHPARYVLSLDHAALDLERYHEVEKRMLEVPELGSVHFDQFSFKPNVVRVVIPLKESQELRVLPQSTSHRLLVALSTPQVQEHAVDFSQQRITSLKVDKTDGAVRITLRGTGPFQYEWHRLKAPDNRFFLDISGAVLAGERQTVAVGDPYVSEVNLGQFQKSPNPTVRLLVEMEKPADVKVYPSTSESNVLVVEARHKMSVDEGRGFGATQMPTKGPVVCIDAGHGGSDPGALNATLGIFEKDVTLDVARRLAKALRDQGWQVVMTRDSDRDVSYAGSSASEELGARVKVAHDFHANLFISIHCNSAANQAACGSSTHWYKESDKVLASFLHPQVVSAMACPNRGLQKNRFYVLRCCRLPAVLIETAFISNDSEGKKLADPDYRQHLAEAIAGGLRTYVAHQGGAKASRPSAPAHLGAARP